MRRLAAVIVGLVALGTSVCMATSPASSSSDLLPTRPLEVLRLLSARDFATLTRAIEAGQSAVERDIRREDLLGVLVDTFDTADPKMAPLLDQWMLAAPQSFAPRLARAVHHVALAWDRRGTADPDHTTGLQLAAMDAFVRTAQEAAREIIAVNPRVGEAHRVLIKAAMAARDQRGCADAAASGLAQLPASMRIRSAYATCLLPRWGGSYRRLEEFVNGADAYVGQNPALAALRGFVYWDHANLAASGTREEIEYYDRAVHAGEFWPFYRDRARAHAENRRYAQALDDATRALELSPDDPATLLIRARALSGLERHAEARETVQLVAEIEPTSRHLAGFRRRELSEGALAGHQLYKAGDLRGAVERFSRTIELTGGDAEVLYWRGRAYLQLQDRLNALVDFQNAIRFDPKHFDSYLNADFVLTGSRNWDRIISYWTEYLAVEPKDIRGYYLRAAAKYRKGATLSAMSDVEKACRLGGTVACEIARGFTP